MSFLHLYKFAEELAASRANLPAEQGERKHLVPVKAIEAAILDREYAVEVEIWPVDIDEDVSLGHVLITDTKQERYEDDGGLKAEIRFSRKLNTCWGRFVCCKEMMHLFDGPNEVTDTKEKFIRLLKEIEARPIDRSAALTSEFRAEWMALLVLCPKPERDKYKALYEGNAIGRYDVAWHFRVPQEFVPALMSEYYETAHQTLIADLLEPVLPDPNEPLAA